MEKNVGKIDKIIRIVVAVLIAAAGFYYNIWWLYLVALVPLATALMGYCGLYSLIKVNTNK